MQLPFFKIPLSICNYPYIHSNSHMLPHCLSYNHVLFVLSFAYTTFYFVSPTIYGVSTFFYSIDYKLYLFYNMFILYTGHWRCLYGGHHLASCPFFGTQFLSRECKSTTFPHRYPTNLLGTFVQEPFFSLYATTIQLINYIFFFLLTFSLYSSFCNFLEYDMLIRM